MCKSVVYLKVWWTTHKFDGNGKPPQVWWLKNQQVWCGLSMAMFFCCIPVGNLNSSSKHQSCRGSFKVCLLGTPISFAKPKKSSMDEILRSRQNGTAGPNKVLYKVIGCSLKIIETTFRFDEQTYFQMLFCFILGLDRILYRFHWFEPFLVRNYRTPKNLDPSYGHTRPS